MITGVLLAAGFARRMGRQKLLLAFRGKPIVRWAAEALASHVGDLVVVTGQEEAAVRQALVGLAARFVRNPRPHEGQGSSIAVGVGALKPWTRAAIIALGDQPRVPGDVLPALLAAWERSQRAIVAPVYRGVHGTPVLFAAALFGELTALTGDAGARALVQAQPDRVELVAFDVPMPADVDTPEDYARLHVQ